jgi:protein CpxP
MKRTKLAALALAAVAGMALAAAAFPGQEGHHGPGGHGGPRGPHGPHGGNLVEHLSRALDLTDAQKAQVKQIEDSLRESTKSLHEQLAKSADGGGPLDGFREGFDEAAVRSAAQARAAAHVELEVAHARAMSQIYALLTAEQKAKLAELRQQMQQRRPGPGAPPPPPPGEGAQ